jgi:hypothetical protein
MRNLMMCDIQLHASTVTSTFEEAMVRDVMPDAGDGPHPPGTLFVRSLYSAAGDGFPPAYRCIVHSVLPPEAGFFGMRRAMHLLGAGVSEPVFRPVVGMLPDDEAAAKAICNPSRSLVMITLHLPARMIPETFEAELAAALSGEVGVSTRLNNVAAAYWTRDDDVVPGRTEYLVAAIGDFMEPQLRDHTIARIETAGGRLVDSLAFHHVGTVSGDGS